MFRVLKISFICFATAIMAACSATTARTGAAASTLSDVTTGLGLETGAAYSPVGRGGYFPPDTPPVAVNPGPTAEAIDYPVMYGTTRRPTLDGNGNVTGYSLARDDTLHYGRAWVTIPKNHRTGSLGSATGGLTGNNPLLVLHTVDQVKDEDAFIALAEAQLPPVTGPETGYVLVFLHGFNNDFTDVARRAAQVGADLGVPPNDMFMFSWPSMHSIKTYPVDEATVDASEVFLQQFLDSVAKAANGRTIHVIAHSMGNRAMLRVVSRMAAEMTPGQTRPFGQVILASADVDSEVFAEFGPAFTKVADRTTVYLSPYDFAVVASTRIHDYPRVGCGSAPQVMVPGIDSVVSTLPDEFPSHAYFAEAIPILADVKNLILRNEPLRPAPGWQWMGDYWRVGPPVETLKAKALACPPHPLYRISSEAAR